MQQIDNFLNFEPAKAQPSSPKVPECGPSAKKKQIRIATTSAESNRTESVSEKSEAQQLVHIAPIGQIQTLEGVAHGVIDGQQVRIIQPPQQGHKLEGITTIFNRNSQEVRVNPNSVNVEIDGSGEAVVGCSIIF